MLKRKGIVAVPGEYKYGDDTEIKAAEELRLAAERQPIIMITDGHPVDGLPSAKDVIGTLSQKWNKEHQRVEGDFWFHEEKISDAIRDKIVNYEPLAISPGFMLDGIEEGVQKGIVYTHMAILNEQDPRCPLGECGVNLRMDSKDEGDERLYRLDQKTEVENAAPEPEPEPAPETAPETPEPEEDIPDVVTEEQTIEEPAEQKPEEEPEPEEVQREPEVVIPKPVGSSNELTREGKYVTYVPKIYRRKDE